MTKTRTICTDCPLLHFSDDEGGFNEPVCGADYSPRYAVNDELSVRGPVVSDDCRLDSIRINTGRVRDDGSWIIRDWYPDRRDVRHVPGTKVRTTDAAAANWKRRPREGVIERESSDGCRVTVMFPGHKTECFYRIEDLEVIE